MKNLRASALAFTLFVFMMGSVFSTVAQNCNPPTGIHTGIVTANSAQILFVPAPGAIYCQLQYRVAGTNAWSPLSAQTPAPTPILTIYNLMDSTTYEVQLRSICGSNLQSAWSPIFTFTTLSANGTCPPPAGITVSAVAATSVTLSWPAVQGVSNYYVYFKPANSTSWTTYQVTSLPGITLNNLSPNTPYEYKIRSFCQGFGLGAWSATGIFSTSGTASTCPVPSGVTAGNITPHSAAISWLAVQGGVGYQIQYRITGSLAWSNMTATAPGVNLSGLTSNTGYELQVRTICGQNAVSNWSAMVTFTTFAGSTGCPPPTGIVVSAVGNNWATISWNPVPGVSLYYLSYKKASLNNWFTVSTNTNSKTIFNLSDTTPYQFRVRCFCPGNATGAFSPVYTFTTTGIPNPCNPPTGIQTTNITSTSAKISWSPVPGAMAYQLRYRISGSQFWKSMTTQQSVITLNQLFDTTQYEYQVSSLCGSNAQGVWSSVLSFTTLAAGNACPPVSGITVGQVTNHTAGITWMAPAQGSYFQVYYQKAGTGNWMLKTTHQPGVMLTYLSDSTKYYFRIRRSCGISGNAGNLGNMSSLSPVDSFITLSAQASPCLPPVGLNFSNLTAHSAKVLWNPVPGSYHYRLRYRPAGAQNWIQQITQLPERMLTNLIDSMTYEVQVASFCGPNTISAWSPSLTFFTPDDPNTVSPRMLNPDEDGDIPSADEEFILYPNPAMESFSLSTETDGYRQVILFNVHGQMLRCYDLEAANRYSLDGIASGLYIIRLANGEQMSAARKLMVK
ncbi:MAG TPA: fibronectin type III domain-containing protein [Bacteroidales bacterium]|nr:fibronectin type III domain-containing protein [Bacteroidales bacterium]HRZ49229.1 fibronectin type III domain-containing protein [Bacteroidales bacterium]